MLTTRFAAKDAPEKKDNHNKLAQNSATTPAHYTSKPGNRMGNRTDKSSSGTRAPFTAQKWKKPHASTMMNRPNLGKNTASVLKPRFLGKTAAPSAAKQYKPAFVKKINPLVPAAARTQSASYTQQPPQKRMTKTIHTPTYVKTTLRTMGKNMGRTMGHGQPGQAVKKSQAANMGKPNIPFTANKPANKVIKATAPRFGTPRPTAQKGPLLSLNKAKFGGAKVSKGVKPAASAFAAGTSKSSIIRAPPVGRALVPFNKSFQVKGVKPAANKSLGHQNKPQSRFSKLEQKSGVPRFIAPGVKNFLTPKQAPKGSGKGTVIKAFTKQAQQTTHAGVKPFSKGSSFAHSKLSNNSKASHHFATVKQQKPSSNNNNANAGSHRTGFAHVKQQVHNAGAHTHHQKPSHHSHNVPSSAAARTSNYRPGTGAGKGPSFATLKSSQRIAAPPMPVPSTHPRSGSTYKPSKGSNIALSSLASAQGKNKTFSHSKGMAQGKNKTFSNSKGISKGISSSKPSSGAGQGKGGQFQKPAFQNQGNFGKGKGKSRK